MAVPVDDDTRAPKVSVAITTYDHERFIAQALDSALAQTADFDIELVVCDDASTDRTPEIVAEYARRHPGRVRATLNEVNEGANANFVHTLGRCRGELVALLDGDDWWTTPTKLQRQVARLDAEPDLAMVFAPATVIDEQGRKRVWRPPRRRDRYSLDDIIRGNFIATSSVVIRNVGAPTFPDWFDETAGMPGDWIFFCMMAQRGDIGYLDDPMSAYRLHGGGLWSADTGRRVRRLRASLDAWRRLGADLDDAHEASFRHAERVLRTKIAIERTAPVVVEPLVTLRGSLTEAVDRVRR